jgi:hypothetical protein
MSFIRSVINGTAAGVLAAIALAAGCAAPTPPPPGSFTTWGYVQLVPHEGVSPSGGAYGDRRVRDAKLVDYSKPGFVVIFADGPEPPSAQVTVRIVSGVVRAHFEPARSAIGFRDEILVKNEDAQDHLLSCPEAGVLVRVEPGETATIVLVEPGPLSLYLLDGVGAEAQIFAAPGPFAVTTTAGRFELAGLAPGRRTLRLWHPRFPSVTRVIEAEAGEILRVDVEMGVQRGDADEVVPDANR